MTTTAVPLVCEPGGHGGCQHCGRSSRAFGKGGSAPDRVGCLGEQFVFLHSMLGQPGSGAVRLPATPYLTTPLCHLRSRAYLPAIPSWEYPLKGSPLHENFPIS